MRIFGFVLSAAVLHVVVFTLSPDNNSQKVNELLVGVTLVQRQMDPLAAHAEAPSSEQEQPSTPDTEHPLATQPDKVNIADRQKQPDNLIVQELPVVTNDSVPESDGQLPAIVEEPPTRPAQRPRQPQPPPEPDVDIAPDETLTSSPKQTNPPAADPQEVAEILSRDQRLAVEQGVSIPAKQQIVNGAQTAKEPLVEQVAAQPRYGYNPAPAYPRLAVDRGWEGTVEFKVRVLTSGKVGEVKLKNSSGYKSLDDAARRAIKRWRFTPASRAGKDIESWVVVPVHFVLDTSL